MHTLLNVINESVVNSFTEISITREIIDYSRPKISSSKDAYMLIKDHFKKVETLEEVYIALFDTSLRVNAIAYIGTGSITQCLMDIKYIAAIAVAGLAQQICIYHNHPSGNLNPSQADIHVTKRIQTALKTLDIELLDHIIVTKHDYYSLKDNGHF